MPDGFSRKYAVSPETDPGEFVRPLDDRNEGVEAPFSTGDILAKTVKADQNMETVPVEKIENLMIEQAAVRAQGIGDFLFATVLI